LIEARSEMRTVPEITEHTPDDLLCERTGSAAMLSDAIIEAPVARSEQTETSFFGHMPHSDDAGHEKRRSLQMVAFVWVAHPKARPVFGAFEVHVCSTAHALPLPHSAAMAAVAVAVSASNRAKTRGVGAMLAFLLLQTGSAEIFKIDSADEISRCRLRHFTRTPLFLKKLCEVVLTCVTGSLAQFIISSAVASSTSQSRS
jgi:hypothetical protein